MDRKPTFTLLFCTFFIITKEVLVIEGSFKNHIKICFEVKFFCMAAILNFLAAILKMAAKFPIMSQVILFLSVHLKQMGDFDNLRQENQTLITSMSISYEKVILGSHFWRPYWIFLKKAGILNYHMLVIYDIISEDNNYVLMDLYYYKTTFY